MTKQHWQTNCH